MSATNSTEGKNYYEIFGVAFDAPAETIRRAWLLRIRTMHPDRIRSEDPVELQRAASLAAEMNSAYTTLQDTNKRLQYDLAIGIRPARCSACGADGALRRGTAGGIVAACASCWSPETSVFAY